jgi:hypothetical protein
LTNVGQRAFFVLANELRFDAGQNRTDDDRAPSGRLERADALQIQIKKR